MKIYNVLITGVSSGMGRATADYFAQLGHSVYGIDVCKTDLTNIQFFKADITNQDELLKIKNTLKNNGIVLDEIINFAGIHVMGSFIEEDINSIKKIIDINVIGTMLVNKTFYELLDKHGRIIITTSEVANLDPMPFNGIYNVSKTALECYAHSLRQELNLKGQKVITIRPGAVKTALCDNSVISTQKLCETTVLYKQESAHFESLIKKFMGTPIPAEKIAKLAYKITVKKRPKCVYKIHHNPGLTLLNILPKSWQCKIVKSLLK